MANTDFTEYAEFLRITAPETVKHFEDGYEDPTYLHSTHPICQRCFAHVNNVEGHNEYHRALSLVLWVMGSTMNSLTGPIKNPEEQQPPKGALPLRPDKS